MDLSEVPLSRYSCHMKLTVMCALLLFSLFAKAQSESWEAHTLAGKAAFDRGDIRVADQEFRAALHDAENLPEPDPRRARSLTHAALVAKAEARYSEAESLLHRAIQLLETGSTHDKLEAQEKLAALYVVLGRSKDAEQIYHSVIADLEGTGATKSTLYAVAM